MRCEVCGRKIMGPSFKKIIEGANMLVCGECAKLGSVSWEAKTEPHMKKVARRLPTQPTVAPRKQPSLVVDESLELADNFGVKIRKARETLGMSHEDLGKRINEKVSVLRRIEMGKMTPNNLLKEKLQRTLKIKLIVPVSEPKVPAKALASSRSSTPTLGDIAMVKGEKDAKKQGN